MAEFPRPEEGEEETFVSVPVKRVPLLTAVLKESAVKEKNQNN